MSITRQKQLIELALISEAAGTNEQVKTALGITSFDSSTIESDISQLQVDVSNIEIDITNLQTEIVSVSGDLATDISNVDLAFTQILAEEALRADVPVISGAGTTVSGNITVNINGVPYKLAVVD